LKRSQITPRFARRILRRIAAVHVANRPGDDAVCRSITSDRTIFDQFKLLREIFAFGAALPDGGGVVSDRGA
jgi:hypothetical protein